MDSLMARKVHVEADFAPDNAGFVCTEEAAWHFDVGGEVVERFFRNDEEGREQCYGIE